MSKVLLIDYENVQGISLALVAGTDWKVCIFTGTSQNRIPITLVASAQTLGDRLSWIRIDGSGPNALDFHIAYYLGSGITKNPDDEYYILSKDKGFDPLVKHITKGKTICKRITSMGEIASARRAKEPDTIYGKVVTNLKKIEKGRRPRNKKTLRQHVKSLIGGVNSEVKLDRTIEQLFSSKLVVEEHGKLIYRL
jgi:hypothetical protein